MLDVIVLLLIGTLILGVVIVFKLNQILDAIDEVDITCLNIDSKVKDNVSE